MDIAFLSIAAIAVVILGLSKGGFAGIGMASTPLVAAVSDPLTAVAVMLPIMLVQDAVAVFLYHRDFDRQSLQRMLPGGVLGVLLAYLLAATVPDWGVKALLGSLSLVFSLWQALVILRGFPDLRSSDRFDRVFASLAGFGSGFSSAIAHAGPPPFQIYALPKRLQKEVYVGTSVMFFAAINVVKVPSFAALGLFTMGGLKTSLLFVPLAAASSWLGSRLVRSLDPRAFNLVIVLIMLVISLVLLGQAATAAQTASSV